MIHFTGQKLGRRDSKEVTRVHITWYEDKETACAPWCHEMTLPKTQKWRQVTGSVRPRLTRTEVKIEAPQFRFRPPELPSQPTLTFRVPARGLGEGGASPKTPLSCHSEQTPHFPASACPSVCPASPLNSKALTPPSDQGVG